MASLQLVQSFMRPDLQASAPLDVQIDLLFQPITGSDEDYALARAVMVSLNTDRYALDDDILPGTDQDRRGWCGDYLADRIWNGWPIGSRLWLLSRGKITDSSAREGATLPRAERYINEALQPFIDNKICSKFTVDLQQTGREKISGTITLYRGPTALIALQFQELWSAFGG